ncbi:hypothetical protein QVD17_18855 [Tagetes erecta]|uniref:HTH La-type RNA-binding domain-containing protein n=1 Tax=Tagetes erecta TaxID=13708 RepID=A0AAD8KLZ0_TARER|nr:hypothetical protein QVD17_18855 [Tagetes erecta]
MKFQFTCGGDDGYVSSVRSLGFSPPIESVEIGELLSPLVSASSPVISEQIADGSTDSFPPDMVSFNGDLSAGCGSEGGGNAVKKAVWSKPAKVVEVVGSVMDEVVWPALGEFTKSASAKSSSSSSSELLEAVSDGSLLSALQVTGNSSSSSQKPASVDSTLTSNHATNSGQRSLGRSGGVSGAYSSSNRGVSKGSVENYGSEVESQSNLSGKPATALSFYPKERCGFRSQSNSGNDNRYQRNSYWKGNGRVRSRGGGSYNHSYGGKPDQGRGNQEWNQHRNVNRNINMHSQSGGFSRGGYIRPPAHNTAPFFYPPVHMPVGPFGNNVTYPDVAAGMNYFQGIAPPTVGGPIYFPSPDPLHDKIVNQINYYFSNDNLVKDTYLRRHMDEQGWVPVGLIARFNKVSSLTDNVQLILDVMQKSTVVEVQGDKMRRQNDWMRWLMPPSVEESLGSQLQGIGLEERFSSMSSQKFFNQLQQGGGDRAQVA